MSNETCWIASFSKESVDYYNVTHKQDCDSSDFLDVLRGTEQKNGPPVDHIGTDEDIGYFNFYKDRCAELIPFRKLLELHYPKDLVPKLLELGLTADSRGVNVLHNEKMWNLSIHFSCANMPPVICLKSSNVLTTLEGRAIQPFSTDEGNFLEVLQNCHKDDRTIEVSFNGEYREGAEGHLKNYYPTLVKKHGAPETKEKTVKPPPVAGSKDPESKSGDWSTTAWVLGGLAILLLLGIGYSYRQSLWDRPQSV